MDFKKMVETFEVPIAKLSVKNKGSIVKIGSFYVNFYNDLLEKYGIRCKEKMYLDHEKTADGLKSVQWKWFAYKGLDTFARLRFNHGTNAYFVKGDKIMGIFSVEYTIELDYQKTWRNNSFLKWLLPWYLKYYYQGMIIQFVERYQDELNSIKADLRKRLNVSTFD